MSPIMKDRFDEKGLAIEIPTGVGGPEYTIRFKTKRCAGTAMRIVGQTLNSNGDYLAERIRLEQAAEKTEHLAIGFVNLFNEGILNTSIAQRIISGTEAINILRSLLKNDLETFHAHIECIIDVIVATNDYYILAAAINTFGEDDKFDELCELYGKKATNAYLKVIASPSSVPFEHRLALLQSLAACAQDHSTFLLASQEIKRMQMKKAAEIKKPFVIESEDDLFALAPQKRSAREDN